MLPGVEKMPLSCKILKGPASTGGRRVLELRHRFICEAKPEEAVRKEVDPAVIAGKILDEAEARAHEIICGALEAAREREERIIQEALKEAGRIKEKAREEGFEAGKKEVLDAAGAEAASIRDQARSVLRQAEEIRRSTLKAVESEIVHLAIEIAEKVLAVKLDLHPQVVVDIARKAINMLHERDQVVLFVNPGEAHLYEERREDLVKLLSPKGELHIIADHDVGPGGCVAETEFGRVDATLDARWKALLKNLEEIGR